MFKFLSRFKLFGKRNDHESADFQKIVKQYHDKLTELNKALDRFSNVRDASKFFDSDDFYYEMASAEKIIDEAFKKNFAKRLSVKHGIKKISEAIGQYIRYVLGVFGVYGTPTDFDDAQRSAQRHASWSRYTFDPVAGNIVSQLLFFMIGNGIKISSNVKVVDEVIGNILKNYKFDKLQKWDFRRSLLDGEIYYLFYRDNDTIRMRRIIAENVEDVISVYDEPMFFKLTVGDLKYFVPQLEGFDTVWVKNIEFIDSEIDINEVGRDRDGTDYFDGVVIYQFKFGDSIRGEPFLLRALRWLQISEEVHKDVARLVHEIARVIMKKKIYQQALGDVNADTVKDAPPGGYMVVEIPGVKEYEFMNNKIDGSGISQAVRLIRLLVCAGTHTPEHIAYSDASNNNYASILEAKNPYTMFVSFMQDWLIEELKVMLSSVLRFGARIGVFEEEVEYLEYSYEALHMAADIIFSGVSGGVDIEQIINDAKRVLEQDVNSVKVKKKIYDVPISIITPMLHVEDPLKLAQAIQIHNNLGLDWETTMKKLGYDPKEILLNKMRERRMAQQEEEEDIYRFEQGRSREVPDKV